MLCGRAHTLSDTVSLPLAHASLQALPRWVIKSVVSFFPFLILVLWGIWPTTRHYFIGVLSTVPLLSVLRSLASSPLSLLCSDNLITKPWHRAPAPFLFHHVVTLSRERWHFTGFLSPVSLLFVLVNPSTLSPCIVLCSLPYLFAPRLSLPLCEQKRKKKQTKSHPRLANVGGSQGNFSPCSSPLPPICSTHVPASLLHLDHSCQRRTAIKYLLIMSQ